MSRSSRPSSRERGIAIEAPLQLASPHVAIRTQEMVEPAHLPSFVNERLHALLGSNFEALARLLDDDLRYVHATGVRHDKEQYLHFVRTRIRFRAILMRDVKVLECEGVLQLSGILEQEIVRAGEEQPVQVSSWFTEVWRTKPEWRLYAFQSTRLQAD